MAVCLAAVTVGISLDDGDPASPIRHVYFLPVVLAALAFGLVGAVLAGSGALLLFAPVVLPDVERHGLTIDTVEGLVTIVLLLVVGGIVGALRTQSRRQAQRLVLLVSVQELLAHDDPMEILLRRLRALLISRLPIHDVALVLEGGESVSADGEAPHPSSLARAVVRTGRTAFVPDIGEAPRPRRIGAVPLLGASGRIGALIVEADELSSADRTPQHPISGTATGCGLQSRWRPAVSAGPSRAIYARTS